MPPKPAAPFPGSGGAAAAYGTGQGDAAARVRLRRAVALVVMTLFLPGSAQLVAGRKSVGRIALRVCAALLCTLAAVILLGVVWTGFVFWLFSNTIVLGVVRLLLCALAIAWAALFVDAWRLGQPLELQQRHRLAVVGLNGMLCFSVVGSLLFASHIVGVQKGFISAMFGDGAATSAHHGRYNVLLLGGDSGADRWGLRPDSITVASIDQKTGRTILFGLPRNMENFPFVKGSVMAEQFPDGYNCSGCELNSLATWAGDHASLFTNYADPGVQATVEGVEGITGLKINYYAMVNLQGFRQMVDAVGGLTLNVRDRIPIGGIGAPVSGYVEPGVHRLDGFQTLWFARSRVSADDYSRMARQKCVMNAMLQQLSPRTVVTKFEKIAKASEKLVTTDLPASELGTFAELALKARSQQVSTVSFVPPAIITGHPDVAKIHQMIASAIDQAEATRAQTDHTPRKVKRSTTPHRQTTGGSMGNMSDGYLANEATDLSSAC